MATLTEPPLYTLPSLSLPPLSSLSARTASASFFAACRKAAATTPPPAKWNWHVVSIQTTQDRRRLSDGGRGVARGWLQCVHCAQCPFLLSQLAISLSLSSHATMRRLRSCYFLQFSPFRRMSLCVSQGGGRWKEDREIKWEICVRAAHTLWQPFWVALLECKLRERRVC